MKSTRCSGLKSRGRGVSGMTPSFSRSAPSIAAGTTARAAGLCQRSRISGGRDGSWVLHNDIGGGGRLM